MSVPTHRDYLMARVAAARMSAQAVIDSCDEIIAFCMEPEDDAKLRKRTEEITEALEHAGATARALESAEAMIDRVDPTECEPWDEEGDDDEVIEIPRATARKRRS